MSNPTAGESLEAPHRIGPFEFDVQAGCLRRDGAPVKIGARALDVLAALAARRGRTVSKAELLDTVWPDVIVEENNLQVQVSALRKLLGPSAIATIPGRGYRLLGETGETREEAASAAADPVAAGRAGNLPGQPRALIGRDDDLARLVELMASSGLVSLVGAGGVGKTCLALAAVRCSAPMRDGAWLVELAPLDSGDGLPRAVAQALGLPLQGSEASLDSLARALAPMQALLVLDNCEHLVGPVAALCEVLAARAPGVRLLVTSQELLNVAHERVFPVGPLALAPAVGKPAAFMSGSVPAALALFAERARAADPRFALDDANADAVAEICRRLDGLPLAIELAAARVRHVGALGLRDMLDDRFSVLTGGRRGTMSRHRTLRATIEWSHALLTDDERELLHALSVFVGGFTLELAQALVAGRWRDEWAVLDALSHLVDKSLVVAEGGDRPRYRLLETTRAFALERLAEAGRTAEIVERHAQVMLATFDAADEARFGDGGTLDAASYMERLRPELGNLRAAMGWALGPDGDVALAARLAGASVEMLRLVGASQQGLAWMRALDNRPPAGLDDAWQARFWLRLAGLGVNGRLPMDEAEAAAQQAVDGYRRAGSDRRLHFALCVLGWVRTEADRVDEATAVVDEMIEVERPDWPAHAVGQRMNLQATILYQARRLDEALAVLRQAVDLHRRQAGEELAAQIGQANLCFALNQLHRHEEVLTASQDVLDKTDGSSWAVTGYMLTHLLVAQLRLDRLDDAQATMRRAVPEWRRDLSLSAKCAELGLLFAKLGRWAIAARLNGAAEAFASTSSYRGNPLAEDARRQMRALLDAADEDAAAVERWRQEGAALDDDGVAALCLGAPDEAAN